MRRSLIVAVFAVVAMFFSSLAFAGGNPQVDFKGSVMIFPKEDGITNLDLSKLDFNTSTIPKGFSSLIGKVYRGEFKRLNWITSGSIMYIMILKGEDEKIVLAVSIRSVTYGVHHAKMICPSDILELKDFRCEYVRSSTGTKFKLSLRKNLPVIDATDGWGADFQEAGEIPRKIWQNQ